jgi:hypothetical protein
MTMVKLDFNKQRKEISDQEIAKYKDFDTVIKSYIVIKPPFYKTKWFISSVSLAAAAVAALLLYFSVFHQPEIIKNQVINNNSILIGQKLPNQISPPIASMTIPSEKFTVDASRGGTITNKNGSHIHVPSKAFVDKKGKLVSGKVELRYREFNNPIDIFLSGIPTHYDSAGQTYFFQSAGMMEIQAYQDDDQVILDKNKKIDVDMTSFFSGNCNVYHFDTSKNQWISNGQGELIEEKKQSSHLAVAAIPFVPADTTVLPVLPRKADAKKSQFFIDVDISGFPELAEYKKVGFEVNETYHKFDKGIYNVTWEKASLKNSDSPGNYYLTLMTRDSSVTILVYPVFGTKTYDKAVAIYNEKQRQRDAEVEKQKSQNTANNNSSKNSNASDRTVNTIADIVIYSKLKPFGKRCIHVTELGFYNCNLPVIMPSCPKIHPTFADISGKPIHNAKIFIFDRSRNLLFNFGNSAEISFRKNASNLCWIVTDAGEIGVLLPETFATLTKDNEKPVLDFKLTDPSTGIDMLKEYLNI